MRILSRVLAGHDLVGLAALPVEVKNEFKARGKPPLPVPRHPRPLIPDVPREAPPALGAHPFDPCIPIGDDFVFAVDQPNVDQHLSVVGHWRPGEHAAHQGIPIGNAA